MDDESMKEFVVAVEEMRTAQRDYFQNRSKRALQASLRLERRIDALVTEMKTQLHIERNIREQGRLGV